MTAEGFGYSCAVALAVVLAVAALAKARDLAGTEASFTALGLPRAATLARVVPAVEAGAAAVLVLTPALGGLVAVVLLAFFTTFLAGRLRSGARHPCSCFGSTRQEPISPANLVGNALLILLALGSLAAMAPTVPTLADGAALTGALGLGVVVHALVKRAASRTENAADVASRGTSAVGPRRPVS